MPNSVFEGLDEILARQKDAEERAKQEHQEILDALNHANEKGVQSAVNERNRAFVLKNFIARSVHEYMWLGTDEDFQNERRYTLYWILAAIVSMVACTIVGIAAFGFYTTYTLFENIWLLLMLRVFKYVYKAKRNYNTLDYSNNTFEIFKPDSDGILRRMGYKKKYKWFLILACIAFLSNTIFAWIEPSAVPFLITVLELATLALNIVAVNKVTLFFAAYDPIRFTGTNEAGTAKVVLVYNTIMNRLYTEEDYLKEYPYMK